MPSANKFHTQKSSIQGNSSPSNDAQQYLSSRLNGTVKNTKNQPILSPISKNGADKTVSTVKINKALKKSTQSSSVLKNKKHSESQNEKNSKLPKLKKEVSIKETNMDDARSAVGSNSDSGSVENVFRNKLRQGTPMSIIESNADKNEANEANGAATSNKVRMPEIEGLAAVKHGKSNSLATNSFAQRNQNMLGN